MEDSKEFTRKLQVQIYLIKLIHIILLNMSSGLFCAIAQAWIVVNTVKKDPCWLCQLYDSIAKTSGSLMWVASVAHTTYPMIVINIFSQSSYYHYVKTCYW